MKAKVALCKALLEGRVLNVKNCFTEIGYTNISREIPRLIEEPFMVQVSRTPKKGKNRYGDPVTWVDFRLNKSKRNQDGIKLMEAYIEKHSTKPGDSINSEPKTEIQTYKLF